MSDISETNDTKTKSVKLCEPLTSKLKSKSKSKSKSNQKLHAKSDGVSETEATSNLKGITISGTNNRYMMKKVLKNDTEKVRHIHSNYRSCFETHDNSESVQVTEDILKNILNTYESYHGNTESCIESMSDFEKYIFNTIKKKRVSYQLQDKKQKRFEECGFISLCDIFNKLISENLKCYYCSIQTQVIYKYSREPLQWTLERKNNHIQHTNDNCVVACLNCNLKRRNSNYDAFKYAKSLKEIKKVDV